MGKILVTGATGNVGSKVVRELLDRGTAVRAFVRDQDKASRMLGAGVEISVGDFNDAPSVRHAMDGISAVLLSSGDGPEKVYQEIGVIDAAVAAGVRRIVKISTLNAEIGSPLPPFDWHGRIERYLRQAGVPAIVLQSNFYMTNMLASAESIKQTGKLVAPAGDGRISMIDPVDVATVAAIELTSSSEPGSTHMLTGPAAISHAEIAAALSLATGHAIEFVNVPDEAARQAFIAAGMPDWLITHLTALFGIVRQGAMEPTTGTVRLLTGREPRTFSEFAQEHASIFGAQAGEATVLTGL